MTREGNAAPKVLLMGFTDIYGLPYARTPFFRPVNLHEYDIVIADPVQISYQGGLGWEKEGKNFNLESVRSLINKQADDFIEYIRTGNGSLFIILHPSQGTKHALGNVADFGPAALSLSSKQVPATGSALVATGPLANIVVRLQGKLHYTALPKIDEQEWTPLFKVERSGQVASMIRPTSGGGILGFVPNPRAGKECLAAFIDALCAIPAAMAALNRPETTALPDWAERVTLPRERAALAEISQLETRIRNLQDSISSHQEIVEHEKAWKALFCTQGDDLHAAVEMALSVFGFQIARPNVSNKGDILARFGDSILVVEVKGKRKSAAVADVRQCVNWIAHVRTALATPLPDADTDTRAYAEALIQLGFDPGSDDALTISPKGLLAINTYWDTPVPERTEADWPDNVISEAQRDKICLVTGLQLLQMVESVRGGDKEPAAIATMLLSNVGSVSDFLSTDYLRQEEAV